MNDCWNVKSERHSGQYQSCMKISGVPLLPPVLSQECRKEMQYYKVLAKEVEKRISLLQNQVGSESDSFETESTYNAQMVADKDIHDSIGKDISKISPKPDNSSSTEGTPKSKRNNNNIKVTPDENVKKFVIDLSLHIDNSSEQVFTDCSPVSSSSLVPIELPERDNDCSNSCKQIDHDAELMNALFNNYSNPKEQNELLQDMEKEFKLDSKAGEEWIKETANVTSELDKQSLSVFVDLVPNDLSACSSKSFTGSLIDLQSECVKESELGPGLVRQRSYTILEPSPQLMAHLAVESQNKGIAVSSISMSDSVHLNSNHQRRRSWDLETAKEKWSSMANELKQKNSSSVNRPCHDSRNSSRMNQTTSPYRSHSVVRDKRTPKPNNKNRTMSESIERDANRYALKRIPTDTTLTKESISPANKAMMKDAKINHTARGGSPKHAALLPEFEDRGQKIKELYEKIQKQQSMQMASLKEKQKQEEAFLQKIFEEQNNILFKQLKMICPKSPTAVRKAWGEDSKEPDEESGPVSLSQLNHISKAPSVPNSPASKTLSKTNDYINQCNDVLKKSRDITSSIKQSPSIKQTMANSSFVKPSPGSLCSRKGNGSKSPPIRNTSRKLNYESTSDYEPILTDRTNDTLADLNVTFPSDSEDSRTVQNHGTVESSKDTTVLRQTSFSALNGSVDLKSSVQISVTNSMSAKRSFTSNISPTPKNCAAASTIVAYAKGFLVRRLMRTERVRATVQTIRDALLCALQLHQDREGIRGADVDLHRRLIQQITAACYSLHDTFVSSTPAERCALIAADRARQRAAAARQSPALRYRQTDVMSRSHSGVFPARSKRPSSATSPMTQSNYETFSSTRVTPNNRRRPWH